MTVYLKSACVTMATDMVFFKIFIVFWCNMSCLLKIEENSQEGSANSLSAAVTSKQCIV